MLILPIVFFAITFLACFAHYKAFRQAYLAAATVWGAALFAITEVLSAFSHLGTIEIAAAWFAMDLFALVWLWRFGGHEMKAWKRDFEAYVLNLRGNSGDIPYGLIGGCALIVVVTGVLAVMSPPNTPDVEAYHMPRVVHWLDQGNVDYYPSIYLPQLFMPPWAEYAMAHLFALGGGDRYVSLVQWLSLLGCGIGVSWIAELLGAPRRGQVLAAAFSMSIPQGILQSSGAKNDYVVAFWLVCCMGFLISFKHRPSTLTAVMVGLSAGLALLTKGTAYVFLPPLIIAIWAVWPRAIRLRFLQFLSAIAALVLVLNIHHYVRNYRLCAELAGCSTADAEKNGTFAFANRHFGVGVTASNLIRNAALHFGTPDDDVNRKLTDFLSLWIGALGIDPNEPGTTWPGTKFQVVRPLIHEDVMGNPSHLLLIFAAIATLVFGKHNRQIGVISYAAGLTLAFIGFCAYLCWQPWHTRLHLPMFVLWSPLVGVVFSQRLKLGALAAGSTVLLMLSMPALFENRLRPLFTEGNSVFNTKREALYSGSGLSAYPTIGAWADRVSCVRVGIDAPGSFDEYPLLMYLHAGFRKRDIRMLGVRNKSAKYTADLPFFQPDCVICLQCLQSSEKWRTYENAGLHGVPETNLVFFYRSEQLGVFANLAAGKAASQSSINGPAIAARAVDGDTDGNYNDGSVSHTGQDPNAWWQVDLGASANISSIVIWNRTDCCVERLSDYWVFVSDIPFGPNATPTTLQNRPGTWSSHQAALPNPSATITVNARGRYIRVQLSGTNYLHMAEVQVFGP